jgi:hypothetical protein
LTTGNRNAYAADFQVLDKPLEVGGFACHSESYGKGLGPIPEYGVDIDVRYQDTSIRENHGEGKVVSQVICR